MSLTTSEMSPADIAAVTGGGNRGGSGFGDGQGWWIILLFLALAGVGGWGNNGNGGGNGGGGNSGASFYPYYLSNNTDNGVNRGFDNLALSNQLNGIQSGVQNLSTQLCNCCSDMQQTVSNGFSQAEIAENARQMANMQQMFNLSSQFADCCCENRLAVATLGADIAREACADRATVTSGVRDIIANQTAGIQTILDKLCQQELDAERRENANLRTELIYARGQASQDVQTARILAGQTAEVDALYNRLTACPIPSEPVYGRQPIFTCNNNSCGCGCGNGF